MYLTLLKSARNSLSNLAKKIVNLHGIKLKYKPSKLKTFNQS